MMDFEIEGVRWWSIIVLDGYSRTLLAGAVSASEASWVALTVLFTACQRYGVPQYLISDKGGAYISDVFEAVCTRLGIDHKKITGKDGKSYMNLIDVAARKANRLSSQTRVDFSSDYLPICDAFSSHYLLMSSH